jgi:hypothetical protein
MLWPLWRHPLDPAAILALLSHPALRPADASPTLDTRSWPPLGIFSAYGAERQRIPGRTFEGVLAPIRVTTTPDRQRHPADSNHRDSGPTRATPVG